MEICQCCTCIQKGDNIFVKNIALSLLLASSWKHLRYVFETNSWKCVRVGIICYYNLIIILMSLMRTYFLVIMILLFRVINIPLGITITCVDFWVHDLKVGILVIYILLHTYLLAIILLFYIILWECIPLYRIVFTSLCLRVGILVIPIYIMACISSFYGLYSSYFKGGYSRYISLVAHIHTC